MHPMEGDEGQAQQGVDGQDVAAVDEPVEPAHPEEDQQPPGEARTEIARGIAPLGTLHLDREAEAEQQREEAEALAADEQPGEPLEHAVERSVDGVGPVVGRRHEAQVLLAEVDDHDAGEGETAQRVHDPDAIRLGVTAPRSCPRRAGTTTGRPAAAVRSAPVPR